MSCKKRQMKVSYKVVALIAFIEVITMIILYTFVSRSVSTRVTQNSINTMKIITTERSRIIENYITEMEGYLTSFSRCDEVEQLLKDEKNLGKFEKAQACTQVYSKDKENIEGIYIDNWNSIVLTHTNPDTIGLVMRKDESLKTLQNSLLNSDGVYNIGILKSPSSGNQVIAMYRACYDENSTPIGFVGSAVYTHNLLDELNNLPSDGMEKAQYCMVNVNTGEYLFNSNKDNIGKKAEESYMTEIISRVKDKKEDVTGTYEYEENSQKYYASYNYMANRGWIFMLSDSSSEILKPVNEVRTSLFYICVAALILMETITLISVNILMKPLKIVENALINLKDYDIRDNEEIDKFINRNDEIGSIAQSANVLIKSLKDIVTTLKSTCTELKEKSNSLRSSSEVLVDCVSDNTATTEEFSASLGNSNAAIENVNVRINSIDTIVNSILERVNESTQSSNKMINSAEEMKVKAQDSYTSSQNTLTKTKNSIQHALESLNNLSKINEMTSAILDIASQTNLLSINASIEAVRAGESGKGFVVVAEEIGILAETSKTVVGEIQNVCGDANASIEVVNKCFKEIIKFIEEDVNVQFKGFAETSSKYSEAVDNIKKQITEISVSTNELNQAVREISSSAMEEKNIAKENEEALGVIIKKNESTSEVAENVRKQSEENSEMEKKLRSIVGKFTIE